MYIQTDNDNNIIQLISIGCCPEENGYEIPNDTSEDILNALKKTSSAFNLAGASIDETIALITTAEVASQRGGKVIGTALSNIAQQLKDEGRLNIAKSLGLDFYTDETQCYRCGLGTLSLGFDIYGNICACNEHATYDIEDPFYIGNIKTGIDYNKLN